MKTFNVWVTRDITESAVMQVKAESEEAAKREAERLLIEEAVQHELVYVTDQESEPGQAYVNDASEADEIPCGPETLPYHPSRNGL